MLLSVYNMGSFWIVLLSLISLNGYVFTQNVSVSNYRLPKDITALHYALTIGLDFDQFKFNGGVSIRLIINNSTSELILNVKDLQIFNDSIELYDHLGEKLGIKSIEENVQLERLIIQPDLPFEAGKFYDIFITYKGNINDDGVGLYRSSYYAGINQQWMAVTQLRPVHARRLLPCFDDPSFRATFAITVEHHRSYKAISNMPWERVIQHREENIITYFQVTPPIPVFLVSIIVSKMDEVAGSNGFFSMATPDNLPSMVYSAIIGPELATAMEKYLDIQYPLNKTHQVALPRLIPVAMENWGLYNFKEENILYLEGESPTIQKQTAARFSAHEICHAWMGNAVSLGWWDYLWMSEVYAMYYEYNIPHMVDPCWRMDEQLVIDLHQAGLLMDSMPVEPLTTTVLTPTEISNKFGGVTYTKGPAILRMAIHILQEQNFLKGFQELLVDYAFKSIPHPGVMWNYLEKYKTRKLPSSLNDIMSTWTITSGYPVVNVIIQLPRITISQVKFSLENDTQDLAWWIPLTYTTSKECDFENTETSIWFVPHTVLDIELDNELDLDENDWVLFNIQSVGFYRVNYNGNNWNNLIKQLQANYSKIPSVNRAQLIDDSFNLARSGKLDYKTAFTLGNYLAYETDVIPWKAAISALDFLDSALLNTSLRTYFKEYVINLVNHTYITLGFEERECDGHTDKINREQIVRLACETGHRHCVEKSIELVRSLIAGNKQRLSADVHETVLCSAVLYGARKEFNYVENLHFHASSRRKPFYLSVLGCSRDLSVIERYLVWPLIVISSEDWQQRFRAFSGKKDNANVLLKILYNNYDPIIDKINRQNFANALKRIENYLTTEEQLKKIIELERKIPEISGMKGRIQKRIQWRDKNLHQLRNFFTKDTKHQLVFSN